MDKIWRDSISDFSTIIFMVRGSSEAESFQHSIRYSKEESARATMLQRIWKFSMESQVGIPIWSNWVDVERKLGMSFWMWARNSRYGFLLQFQSLTCLAVYSNSRNDLSSTEMKIQTFQDFWDYRNVTWLRIHKVQESSQARVYLTFSQQEETT